MNDEIAQLEQALEAAAEKSEKLRLDLSEQMRNGRLALERLEEQLLSAAHGDNKEVRLTIQQQMCTQQKRMRDMMMQAEQSLEESERETAEMSAKMKFLRWKQSQQQQQQRAEKDADKIPRRGPAVESPAVPTTTSQHEQQTQSPLAQRLASLEDARAAINKHISDVEDKAKVLTEKFHGLRDQLQLHMVRFEMSACALEEANALGEGGTHPLTKETQDQLKRHIEERENEVKMLASEVEQCGDTRSECERQREELLQRRTKIQHEIDALAAAAM